MDAEKVQRRLERFLGLCERYDQHERANGYEFDEDARDIYYQIESEVPTVKKIVAALDASLANDITAPQNMFGATSAASATRQAIAIIRDQDELSAMLSVQPPQLLGAEMHRWVWPAAAPFWEAGQHAVAVEQSAKSLTAIIQSKSGSTLPDRELATEVFSPKAPKAGRRLWLPGDRATKTWQSRQDGLHNLAMGAYAGIRNVVAHSHEPGWSEQEALEYLAVLSTVARWTEETTVEHPS